MVRAFTRSSSLLAFTRRSRRSSLIPMIMTWAFWRAYSSSRCQTRHTHKNQWKIPFSAHPQLHWYPVVEMADNHLHHNQRYTLQQQQAQVQNFHRSCQLLKLGDDGACLKETKSQGIAFKVGIYIQSKLHPAKNQCMTRNTHNLVTTYSFKISCTRRAMSASMMSKTIESRSLSKAGKIRAPRSIVHTQMNSKHCLQRRKDPSLWSFLRVLSSPSSHLRVWTRATGCSLSAIKKIKRNTSYANMTPCVICTRT